MRRAQDAGFTLIEALVALGILSTASIFLLAISQSHVARVGQISDRRTALWIAENRLVELELGMVDLPAEVTALGGLWRINTDRSATSDPDLTRVDIRVAASGGGLTAASALLTGFVETRKAGGS
ncbi:type II secretion system minor pseudopilin GspI [uncultured Roseobacter sp.]|uniref:type II secretion system minor pseudopilin GspI n=1 Tax=uncultured Roseobacter sp. TaxID=114847 RepID=UPI002630578A|nr:type II secretion system minor pseudopilin GspI [uncultured Roseobacter sp.]